MCDTTLRVEFATRNFEFASAEDPTNVADNLSKMASLCNSIATQTQAGIAYSQQITVYGRWVVVYRPVQDDSGKYRPSLQFFDLEIDKDLLRAVSEGQEDLETGIIQAIDEYRSVFDPEKHDRVRLLSEPPD